MVKEAALCLEEKIIDRPDLLDAALIFGIGFPPFRGGLLKYADTIGAKAIVEKLEEVHEELWRTVHTACVAFGNGKEREGLLPVADFNAVHGPCMNNAHRFLSKTASYLKSVLTCDTLNR